MLAGFYKSFAVENVIQDFLEGHRERRRRVIGRGVWGGLKFEKRTIEVYRFISWSINKHLRGSASEIIDHMCLDSLEMWSLSCSGFGHGQRRTEGGDCLSLYLHYSCDPIDALQMYTVSLLPLLVLRPMVFFRRRHSGCESDPPLDRDYGHVMSGWTFTRERPAGFRHASQIPRASANIVTVWLGADSRELAM
jgi:hypothetical protein